MAPARCASPGYLYLRNAFNKPSAPRGLQPSSTFTRPRPQPRPQGPNPQAQPPYARYMRIISVWYRYPGRPGARGGVEGRSDALSWTLCLTLDTGRTSHNANISHTSAHVTTGKLHIATLLLDPCRRSMTTAHCLPDAAVEAPHEPASPANNEYDHVGPVMVRCPAAQRLEASLLTVRRRLALAIHPLQAGG